jgi:hypothetical protein
MCSRSCVISSKHQGSTSASLLLLLNLCAPVNGPASGAEHGFGGTMPAARQNGFEPPPSSILATHVVHSNGVPDFDQDTFNQLLVEALGTDEQGRPNLSDDVDINHKFICIVYEIGIERALENDPFRARGKADSHLLTCLEVIQIAIERSPQVVFVSSDRTGADGAVRSCLLYSWLVPALLPLLASGQSNEIRDRVLNVYTAVLEADSKSAPGSGSDSILAFLRECITSKHAPHRKPSSHLHIQVS